MGLSRPSTLAQGREWFDVLTILSMSKDLSNGRGRETHAVVATLKRPPPAGRTNDVRR
jgi:hypothetical protein